MCEKLSVSGRGLEWTEELEDELRKLAEQGFTGYEIASRLSAELGVPISADAVYVKASRLGVSLRGRAPSYESSLQADPFQCPSWLQKALQKAEEPKETKPPLGMVVVNLDNPFTEQELAEQTELAYEWLWYRYVQDVVESGRASESQAEEALKTVPQWFRDWAEVFTCEMWMGDDPLPNRAELQLIWKETVEQLVAWREITEEQAEQLHEVGYEKIPYGFKEPKAGGWRIFKRIFDRERSRLAAYAESNASAEEIKRGLEIESLLKNIDKSKRGTTSKQDARSDKGKSINGGPQVSNAVSSSPVQKSGSNSSAIRGSPFEKCERCGGGSIYDDVLEEWVCGSCGHILRFKS